MEHEKSIFRSLALIESQIAEKLAAYGGAIQILADEFQRLGDLVA